jgi:hypothetical protein
MMPYAHAQEAAQKAPPMDEAKAKDWLARWEKGIVGDAKSRYCDKEMGEEIGWMVTPFLNGFYYGYLATKDPKWGDMLVDWTDSLIKRAVKEPDGYVGWPKIGASGTAFSKDEYADSLLGEAMALRPIVLMAVEMQAAPALKEKYGAKAAEYLKLGEDTFAKWDSRGCWREV